MKIINVLIMVMIVSCVPVSQAEEPDCKIEDLQWNYNKALDWVVIEGTTDCSSGWLYIRVYEDGKVWWRGETGVSRSRFKAWIMDPVIQPKNLSVKYLLEGSERWHTYE